MLQVLQELGVDAGRSHIWDFHATPDNQRALAVAGPPKLPVKKQTTGKKSESSSGEEHEEENEEAGGEVAEREMIWWVYGNGPEYSYESSQQDSGKFIVQCAALVLSPGFDFLLDQHPLLSQL